MRMQFDMGGVDHQPFQVGTQVRVIDYLVQQIGPDAPVPPATEAAMGVLRTILKSLFNVCLPVLSATDNVILTPKGYVINRSATFKAVRTTGSPAFNTRDTLSIALVSCSYLGFNSEEATSGILLGGSM